jgi:hypothetical protein
MQRRLVYLHTIFFEHMKQRCLASIVETQEQDLCALMVEACGKSIVMRTVHKQELSVDLIMDAGLRHA